MRINIENRKELNDYLVKHQQFQKDELTGFQLLSGGVSNRTVMVRLADGKAWVIKQALEKLRVKTDWFCDPARIYREAEAVRFLHTRVPQARVPRFCFEDSENYLLGMESVPEPHLVWKSELLKGQVDAELVVQFAEMLAGIHGCSMETPGLPEVFSDKTYFEALRLEPYYGYAASQIPKAET
ncbi:MAG: phosphotransferase, partial [SAR324 cluster bacterium]|nr:phosphotransferase [SAR324 cluster bacterium]